MSDLVGNPEDQLSHVAAQIEETQRKLEINFGLKKRGCITDVKWWRQKL